MIYKIQNIFEKETLNTKGKIESKAQFENLKEKLFNRRILVQHDLILFDKFIIDFPFNFEEFCSYIKQIYQFDIEKQINYEMIKFEELFDKIFQFIAIFSLEKLNNDDLANILTHLNISFENFEIIINKLKKVNFLFKSVRDDLNIFLWEKINENVSLQKEDINPDFFINNSYDYQKINKQKIDYESNLLKVTRIHYNVDRSVVFKKYKKIVIEKAYCQERNTPIESWKIPNNFFDKETLAKFYNKCEASQQLVLSRHFQKFLGYDDLNNEDHQLYYFEYLTGVNLKNYIISKELDTREYSLIFKYLAKEILICFRDLLYKCTHSFSFPINFNNLFYDTEHLRLYMHYIDFGPPRKHILESDQILESKLLYYYALILIDILSLGNSELGLLSQKIAAICNDFQEFESMQKIFDYIFNIEEILTKELENDMLIAIIIECLISPYKSKIVFDEFYDKKNFLREIFKYSKIKKESDDENKDKENTNEIENEKEIEKEKNNFSVNTNKDEKIAYEPYYENMENNTNEEIPKKLISMKMLLIHPFFEETKFENKFIAYIMKCESNDHLNFIK